MVFNSSAMMAVADVSAEKWQRIRRVASSEMLNTDQLLEIACCFPFGHFVLFLWEVFSLSVSASDDDDDSYEDDDDDDEADDEDMVAFDHSDRVYHHHRSSSSSSSYDFDDDDYHYSHTD